MSEAKRYDFTTGRILPKLLKFMLPVLFALLLQAMYGAVDTLIVGRFGSPEAISGVSSGSNVVNLFVFTVAAFSIGITVNMGKAIGANEHDRVGKIIGGGVALYGVISIGVAILTITLAKPLALLMNAPASALDVTIQYIRICGGCIFFTIAYNLLAAIFRGMGDSKMPLLFVAIACVANVGLDLLFVKVLGLNVMGAAWATIIAQVISVVLSLVILKFKKLPFKFSIKDIRFNKEIKNIFKVGWPIGFQEIMVMFSFMMLCSFVNKLGIDASNGYGVANRVTQFAMLIPSAILQSLAAFISQNVGAKKEDRATQSMIIGMSAGAIIGLGMAALCFFVGDKISGIFTEDINVIEQSFLYLKGFALESVLTAILFSFIGYFNAHGKTLWSMIQSVAATFLVRLPLSYLFSILPDTNLLKIGLATPIATVFGIILNVVYLIIFRKKINHKINTLQQESL